MFAVVGMSLLALAMALMTNWRGAGDWWIRYSDSQEQLFGYAPVSPRATAGVVGVLGVLFVAVPLLQ